MIKILAVDDEQGMRLIIKETFAPMGFTVLCQAFYLRGRQGHRLQASSSAK